jgi:hypothetical protein
MVHQGDDIQKWLQSFKTHGKTGLSTIPKWTIDWIKSSLGLCLEIELAEQMLSVIAGHSRDPVSGVGQRSGFQPCQDNQPESEVRFGAISAAVLQLTDVELSGAIKVGA